MRRNDELAGAGGAQIPRASLFGRQKAERGLLLLVAGLLFVLAARANFQAAWPDIGTRDWAAYWAHAHSWLQGAGYADVGSLLHVQESTGYPVVLVEGEPENVLVLYNPPPLTLPLIPFGALPHGQATWLWLACSTLVYAFAALRFNRELVRPLPSLVALGLALLGSPLLWVLNWGQVSALLTAFALLAWLAQRRGQQRAAGVLMVPLLLKPHLTAGVLVALLWVAWRQRARQTFAAAALFGLLLGVVAFVLDPRWPLVLRRLGEKFQPLSYSPWDLATQLWGLPPWFPLLSLPIGVVLLLWALRGSSTLSPGRFSAVAALSLLFNPWLPLYDSLLLAPLLLWLGAALWHGWARLWLLLPVLGWSLPLRLSWLSALTLGRISENDLFYAQRHMRLLAFVLLLAATGLWQAWQQRRASMPRA